MKTNLVVEVEESIRRIRGVDPGAYPGFVLDAAAFAVARRVGMRATDVVRAYRAFHSVTWRPNYRRMAVGKRVSDEAKAVA